MKKFIIIGLSLLIGLLFHACNQPKKTLAESIISSGGDNSSNAPGWDGIYRGVLPCADCPGIQTTVYLNKDLTYRVKLKYFGKETSDREYAGKFSWNTQGNTITLEKAGNDNQPVSYLVGENILTQLDTTGNTISRNNTADYVLTKSNYAIVEKYWKLTELYGRAVVMDSTFGKEPHIILKELDNRVNGTGGCNTISGYFEARGLNRITFTKMITTQMACPKMDIETQFLKALAAADNFTLKGDELVLNKARMAPLARFRTVYMK